MEVVEYKLITARLVASPGALPAKAVGASVSLSASPSLARQHPGNNGGTIIHNHMDLASETVIQCERNRRYKESSPS